MNPTTPDALIAKIEEIVGNVPGSGRRRSRTCARTRTRTMTVTAHSAVEPTDAAAADKPGVSVGRASAVWVLDRRRCRTGCSAHADGREDRDSHQPRLRAVLQHQPGAVLRLGDGHPSGIGIWLSQPAHRHCVLHRRSGNRCACRRQRAVAALVLGWPGHRHAARHRLRALADLPEPLPHRRAVPLLHGGVGGHHPTAGRGGLDRAAASTR